MSLVPALAEPPLDPSGEEARSLLGRELLHPDYHEHNPIEQLLDWLDRMIGGTIDAAADAPPLSTFLAIVAFLLLGLALAWLVSRARRTPRVAGGPGPVVGDRTASAAELRAAAERALAEGRAAAAAVDGFRALTVRQIERGWLEDRPGATAREVAVALAAAHPDLRHEVAGSAEVFDAVLYGGRPATHDQAAAVLAVDDALAGAHR
ncbi:DUF4129 domain-containing protein [Nocardioides sp. YIM 152315]|uniref:DUF4129 domain-containing protein n=1 Tax=Nocardioides sp. YIM 152315 TaxID=3031760 RepID=UPI0023DC4FF8|nr:DUF4129 domain-containing protein [Nocardioides sp. YIM 152315]MDF1604798.1 DUF4129 domain-containing protein [Nocardioides sp. YIM 152315]